LIERESATTGENRHMDTTQLPEMPYSMGESVALNDLAQLAGVPEEEWRS